MNLENDMRKDRIDVMTRSFKEISLAVDSMARQASYVEDHLQVMRSVLGFSYQDIKGATSLTVYLQILQDQINRFASDVTEAVQDYQKRIQQEDAEILKHMHYMPAQAVCR